MSDALVKTPKLRKSIKILPYKDRIEWKWPLMAVCVASTVVMGLFLMKQWSYAIIGRNVSNDVVRFLEYRGSTRKRGIVEGGLLQVPLPVGAAVTQTVAKVLGVMDRVIDQAEEEEQLKAQQEKAERDEQDRKRDKPQLCYDAPKVKPSPVSVPSSAERVSVNNKKRRQNGGLEHSGSKKGQQQRANEGGSETTVMRNESDDESGGEPGSETIQKQQQAGVGKMNARQLFEPEDVRAAYKDQPIPDIEPYTPPTVMKHPSLQ